MPKLKKILLLLQVIPKLGIKNVLYTTYYKSTLKLKLRKYLFPVKKYSFTGFFCNEISAPNINVPQGEKVIADADKIHKGKLQYFSYHWKEVGETPDWFLNGFNGKRTKSDKHWTLLDDFDSNVGDIKNVWEPSRFSWTTVLARAYVVSSDKKYLDKLNNWILDWTVNNPVNVGPNWKCGQEASIRLINLINTAQVLKQVDSPSENICELIYSHLDRIYHNIQYSIAQDNNHGTSEAAGLFVGGAFLKYNCENSFKSIDKYIKKGISVLEDRVDKLISNAKKENFSESADVDSYQGNWKEILSGVNLLTDIANKFLVDAQKSAELQKRIGEYGTNEIAKVSDVLREIAEGNLTKIYLPADADLELGDTKERFVTLKAGLDDVSQGLSAIISQIQDDTHTLTSSSERLA